VDTTSAQLARAWIEAWRDFRDEDVIALAHPDIVLHPRRGQGERMYEGIDGVRRWLADVGSARPRITSLTIDSPSPGRAVAETKFEDFDVIAVFELRDERVAGVAAYLSDRELLEQLGVIDASD
jgi:hypothetical protein